MPAIETGTSPVAEPLREVAVTGFAEEPFAPIVDVFASNNRYGSRLTISLMRNRRPPLLLR